MFPLDQGFSIQVKNGDLGLLVLSIVMDFEISLYPHKPCLDCHSYYMCPVKGGWPNLPEFPLLNSLRISPYLGHLGAMHLITPQGERITWMGTRGPWQGSYACMSLRSPTQAQRSYVGVASWTASYTIPSLLVWTRIWSMLHLLMDIHRDIKDGSINIILVFLGLHQPLIEASHGFIQSQRSDFISPSMRLYDNIFFLPKRILTFMHVDHLSLTT